jgi:hypothetical protein
MLIVSPPLHKNGLRRSHIFMGLRANLLRQSFQAQMNRGKRRVNNIHRPFLSPLPTQATA